MTEPDAASSHRLASDADVQRGLGALFALDPRLAGVAGRAEPVTLRTVAPSFNGLVRIVIAQQVSTASARAIEARYLALFGDTPPHELALADPEVLKSAGLSAPKVRAVQAAAHAVAGGLDLGTLPGLPVEDAMAQLTAIKGVGPWTAEIFLLFGCGHRDVFPAGDLALQVAATHAFGLDERITAAGLRAMAEAWAPWRGVAAKLLWAYHHQQKL